MQLRFVLLYMYAGFIIARPNPGNLVSYCAFPVLLAAGAVYCRSPCGQRKKADEHWAGNFGFLGNGWLAFKLGGRSIPYGLVIAMPSSWAGTSFNFNLGDLLPF